MVEPALFGPVDAVLAPVVEYVVLVLVLVNLVTRLVAHRSHVGQAEDGADAIARHPVHEATNALLVVTAFYYATLNYVGGVVLSTLVVGMVLADFFEFEARKVEAREDLEIERPKGALFASVWVVGYALYISLFFLVEPLWNAIV